MPTKLLPAFLNPPDAIVVRQHRARSIDLSPAEIVEVRAAQRTFEGAYIRTAIGQFSFALFVLKIFTAEFYSVGALFAVYGVSIVLVSFYRRAQAQQQFFHDLEPDGSSTPKFKTSGGVVITISALSLGAYISLIVLILKLER